MNRVRHFSRIPWTGGWPIARPLPTQGNTTHKLGHAALPPVGFKPTLYVRAVQNTHPLRPGYHWD